jgi:hypothetical protein
MVLNIICVNIIIPTSIRSMVIIGMISIRTIIRVCVFLPPRWVLRSGDV